jgi:Ca2+-binding EF-hand superfamily protein
MSIQELHKKLDTDGDGEVDKREFTENMGHLNIPTIKGPDLGFLFDSLDINDRARLNLVEFSLFIKGAELSKKEKLTQM